jgi:hypothetical protein
MFYYNMLGFYKKIKGKDATIILTMINKCLDLPSLHTQMRYIILTSFHILKAEKNLVVVHACNPSFSGGGSRRAAQEKLGRSYLKNKVQTKGLGMWSK